MASFIQGYEQRTLLLGSQVTNLAQTPPTSGSSATIFTVHTGTVLVTSLAGQVSTALSGTTGAIALGVKPSGGGTEETAGISSAGVVGGAEVGTWVTAIKAITGLAGAVEASIYAGLAIGISALPFLVNPGAIEVTTSVATMTGAIDWYITYVPYQTGAYVGSGTS